MRKWVWQFIACIADLADYVVSFFCCYLAFQSTITPHTLCCHPLSTRQIIFESRLGAHDMGNDCTMTVDGTDFRISQRGAAVRGNAFASHKYAGKSVLRYELGIDILAGNLVWIQGPYPAGKYTDIKIFNSFLRHNLEPGERVEVDNGYVGHADKIKCPDNDINPEENLAVQGRV